MSQKIRVGVLRGGPSSEYEVSLKSGGAVLRELPEKYQPVDIFIDREGTWHIGGIPHEPHRALRQVDVVWNALHGEYGEDGGVQQVLDAFRVPYTGPRTFAAAIAMNKAKTKEFLRREKIKTPLSRVAARDGATAADVRELFRTTPQPSVVKPLSLGSSVGVSVARSFGEFFDALERAFAVSPLALVEEYIAGREATCGVVEGLRGEKIYTLPPVEIVPASGKSFFDYEAKYGGGSQEICPGRFSPLEKIEIGRMAALAHRALGLRHYSRSDFIVSPKRGVYFLEVNTLPGLTAESLLPKSLAAIGLSLPHFLDHVIALALEER